MCLQLPTVFEIGTKATQGSYRWRTVLLGLDAGSTLIEEIFQLCHRQVTDRTLMNISNWSQDGSRCGAGKQLWHLCITLQELRSRG